MQQIEKSFLTDVRLVALYMTVKFGEILLKTLGGVSGQTDAAAAAAAADDDDDRMPNMCCTVYVRTPFFRYQSASQI